MAKNMVKMAPTIKALSILSRTRSFHLMGTPTSMNKSLSQKPIILARTDGLFSREIVAKSGLFPSLSWLDIMGMAPHASRSVENMREPELLKIKKHFSSGPSSRAS